MKFINNSNEDSGHFLIIASYLTDTVEHTVLYKINNNVYGISILTNISTQFLLHSLCVCVCVCGAVFVVFFFFV